MAAAALGNTISDVLGIGSAVYVERLVEVIGVRAPDLTPVQLEMKSARRASNFVRTFDAADSRAASSSTIYLVSFTGPRFRHHCGLSAGNVAAVVHER